MGRNPIAKNGEIAKVRNVRATDTEWKKFLELGGSVWLRKKIKQARIVIKTE